MQPEITEQDRATSIEANKRAAERFAVKVKARKEVLKNKRLRKAAGRLGKVGTKENVPGAFGRNTARMVNRAGFTVVELVIVLATMLVGLLAAGLIGALIYWILKNA